MSDVLDDDCELPPRLVALFLRTAPEQMNDLVNACQRRDAEPTLAHAHKLKGALYAAGASRLANALEELRTSVGAGDWTKASAQLTQARESFAKVIDQWHARLGSAE